MMIPVVAAVLKDAHGRLLLAQRPVGKHLAGTWEFPGGKVDPGETPAQALERELAEELGIRIESSAPLLSLNHQYADRSVRLMLREVIDWQGEPMGLEGQALQWVTLPQASRLSMPAADRPIIRVLQLDWRLTCLPDPSDYSDEEHFLEGLNAALKAGASFVLLPMYSLTDDQAYAVALRCAGMFDSFGARWILGHRPAIARSAGADGVCARAHKLQDFQT